MSTPILTTMQIGRVLQSARKTRNLTQAAVGARLGLSQKRVSAIELDPGSMTADQLLKLCAILGLELSVAPKPESGASPTARTPGKVEW